MQLQGKTVVVTGAAQGIGRAYAIGMGKEGANIVAIDRDDCAETAMLVQQAGGKCLSLAADVTNMAALTDMAARAKGEFGGIHAIVNNAALYGALRGGRFDRIEEAQWDACMEVNVKGIWNCCKAVVPVMRESGYGSIINISSLAFTYGAAFAIHYAVSKAAVVGITRSLARELGREHIRVNSIAPSMVMTAGTEKFFGGKQEQAARAIAGDQSIPENLHADDLVGTAIYLASDASRFVTGQTICVDGGTVFL